MQGICPGATTIVAPKSVGSRSTNWQMNVISWGEFNGFPGQIGPNHADRLDRASRVLSASIPRKKPQAKKNTSVLSIETAYGPTPRRSVPKDQTSTEPFSRSTAISNIKTHNVTINRNRNAIYRHKVNSRVELNLEVWMRGCVDVVMGVCARARESRGSALPSWRGKLAVHAPMHASIH